MNVPSFSFFPDYDKTENENLPNLLCAITGKGPLKYHYQKEISKIHWKKVKIVTPWLESEDYPRLLGWLLTNDFKICI